MKFVLVMIAIAAMMTAMPVITMPQIAKTYTNCLTLYPTQVDRYNCGYNRSYTNAQSDWNSLQLAVESGGDNSCPSAEGHTFGFCDGYQKGYTDCWNAWTYDMQYGIYPFVYLSQRL